MSVVSEAGIKGRDKNLHLIDTMGCNYLSLFNILLNKIIYLESDAEPFARCQSV